MRRGLVAKAGSDAPLALLALAFFLLLVFQTVELVRASAALDAFNRSQDAPLQDTARLRQATESLAGDIAQLAQSGNADAKQIVDEMARQNIVLHAPAAPPTAPAAEAPAPAATPAPASR